MISFYADTDVDQPLKFRDRQGNVIDLTGATDLTVTFYPQPREASAASLVMIDPDVEVTNAVEGEVVLHLASTLNPGEYVYEATATLVTGADVLLGRGHASVLDAHALGA